jgi:hypothetical protein
MVAGIPLNTERMAHVARCWLRDSIITGKARNAALRAADTFQVRAGEPVYHNRAAKFNAECAEGCRQVWRGRS